MKDWKELYPLNTFEGETKEELVKFISSLLSQQRKEVLEEVLKLLPENYSNKELYLKSGTQDYYYMKSRNDTLDEIKSLINKQ